MSLSSIFFSFSTILIICTVEAKLVFPVGSDVGYIVPDADSSRDASGSLSAGPAFNELTEEQFLLSRQVRGNRPAPADYDDLWFPHKITNVLSAHQALGPGQLPVLSKSQAESVTMVQHGKLGRLALKTGEIKAPREPPYAVRPEPLFSVLGTIEGRGSGSSINSNSLPNSLQDSKHGVKMGVANARCDDAKSGLLMDWDYSPANYTCYNPRNPLPPAGTNLLPSLRCDDVPKHYTPEHFCMDKPIQYTERVPSYGDHRPLWPQFGEYKFVPPQRWLHNIEHGSVVMLYHPCTRPSLVQELRALVQGCLYKHVITPYTPLRRERPLALVAWGCVMEMSSVNSTEVLQFIRERALQGPEGTLRKQGQFTEGLLEPSVVPPGKLDDDLTICPH